MGFVMGYTDEASYCPYCGEKIYTWCTDGRSVCSECGAIFFVVEAEDSNREVEE